MGMIEAILFAFLSFTMSVLAMMALVEKKPIIGIILGFATTVSAAISAYNWRLALIDSGKNPELLGFNRYPFVLPVYCVFITLGIACLIIGIIQYCKHRS